MTTPDAVEVPTGKDFTDRWKALPTPMQGELWRKLRKGETSEDEHEALLIAGMAKQRLRDFTMRPELVLPTFIGFFVLLSVLWDEFSLQSAMTAPLLYAAYMLWMRGIYNRAYRRSIERLSRDGTPDAEPDA